MNEHVRVAVGMAAAHARGDMAGAMNLWHGSTDRDQQLALAALIELPGLLLEAVGRDPAATLSAMAARYTETGS